tara:strand:+ start:1232 stop:1504 length:273 start_codon:yes stop_codon:yes gene_type:complete
MISLKSLLRNVREAKLTPPKKGVETPLDAKIQIKGYGVMTRKQLQKSIERMTYEVYKDSKRGKYKNILGSLYKRSVLQAFLETEIQHSGE